MLLQDKWPYLLKVFLLPSLSSPQLIVPFSVPQIDYVVNKLFFRSIFADGLESFHDLLEVKAAERAKTLVSFQKLWSWVCLFVCFLSFVTLITLESHFFFNDWMEWSLGRYLKICALASVYSCTSHWIFVVSMIYKMRMGILPSCKK